MDIHEQRIFKRYTEVTQSFRRAELQRDGARIRLFNGDISNSNRSIRTIKDPYNPIKSDDIPLDKLLELFPKYRYEREM